MTAQPDSVWIGVDIEKAAHHAAAIDDTGRQHWSIRVRNDQHNIEHLLAKARATGDSPTIRWAVDLTSPESALLLAVLIAADQTVTYVPGRVVKRMTGAFPGEGKTDAKIPSSSPKPHAYAVTSPRSPRPTMSLPNSGF